MDDFAKSEPTGEVDAYMVNPSAIKSCTPFDA